MRTTLTLDDELVRVASELTGVRVKSTLVRLALDALIVRESSRRLAALGGTDPAGDCRAAGLIHPRLARPTEIELDSYLRGSTSWPLTRSDRSVQAELVALRVGHGDEAVLHRGLRFDPVELGCAQAQKPVALGLEHGHPLPPGQSDRVADVEVQPVLGRLGPPEPAG